MSSSWTESAADLLAEPDPGPTPMLVSDLLAENAIAAIVGAPKAGKTWLSLEIAVSVVTGQPVLGRYTVPSAGPVLVILEESGRAALHRRLDMLARGRGIRSGQLRDLHFAANARVRLNGPEWQERLIETAQELRPRAILLDPLVRLKGASVDESSQREMGPVLDFMRDLRDAASATVGYVHHTGHAGGHQRGSSDLEAYWESKITLTSNTDGSSELAAEHREAEAPEPVTFRRTWDQRTRTIRLEADQTDHTRELQRLLAYVLEHPGQGVEEIAKGVGRRKDRARSQLVALETAGTVHRARSRRQDRRGRTVNFTGWFPASERQLCSVPDAGTDLDRLRPGLTHGPTVPPFKGGTGDARRSENGNGGVSIEDVELPRGWSIDSLEGLLVGSEAA
jgi:AAA domain